MPDKESEIGALWFRTANSGVEYFSGKIGDQDVVIFKNKSDNPKAPSHIVYKSKPREQAPTTGRGRYESEPPF
jgi:uncharacterized protein (DUF736 family)